MAIAVCPETEEAKASSTYSIAIGCGAAAVSERTIAFGAGSRAQGLRSTAIGNQAHAIGADTIAFGSTAKTNSDNAIAMGVSAVVGAKSEDSIAIGHMAEVSTAKNLNVMKAKVANNSIAIGNSANVSGPNSIALGNHAYVQSENRNVHPEGAIAIGSNALATFDQAIAIGENTRSQSIYGVTIGADAHSRGSDVVAIGHMSSVSDFNSTAVGAWAGAEGRGVAIGTAAKAQQGGVSIGGGVHPEQKSIMSGLPRDAWTKAGREAIAIGSASHADAYASISIGYLALATGRLGTALGYESSAVGEESIALGHRAKTTGYASVALGHGAESQGLRTVSIGNNSIINGTDTVSLGHKNEVYARNSMVLGFNNKIEEPNSTYNAIKNTFILGSDVTHVQHNSVILGHGSQAERSGEVRTSSRSLLPSKPGSYYDGLKFDGWSGYDGEPSSSKARDAGVISVGAKGKERQIIHVAPGDVSATSTDAINGSQLFSTNRVFTNVADTTRGLLGGNAAISQDGSITASNIGKTGKDTVHDAIESLQWKVSTNDNEGSAVAVNLRNARVDFKNSDTNIRISQSGTNLTFNLAHTLNVGPKPIKIDGTQGEITGLSNTTWDPNATYTSRRAATEEQLSLVYKELKDKNNNVPGPGAPTSGSLSFKGDDSEEVKRQLGETLTLKGGADVNKLSDANIGVVANGDASLDIKLAKNLSGLESIKVGDVAIHHENGITIGSEKGKQTIIKEDAITVAPNTTVDMGGNRITNVAQGEKDNDAATVAQVNEIKKSLEDFKSNELAVEYDSKAKDKVSLRGQKGTLITNLASGLGDKSLAEIKGEALTNAVNVGDLQKSVNNLQDSIDNAKEELTIKGLSFKGDGGEEVKRQLGETLTLKGGADVNKLSDANIGVVANGDASLDIKLAKNLSGLESIKVGDVAIHHENGITIGSEKGKQTIIKEDAITVAPNTTVDMGGNRITNVAPGVASTDAVNAQQLSAVNNKLQQQIDTNRDDIHRNNNRANAGVAAAMAAAGLPQAYLPGKSMVAIAGGVWRGESGMAIGVSTVSANGKWVLKGSANTSGRGGAGGTIGAGYQW